MLALALIGLFGLVALLALTGFTFQQVSDWRERRAQPATGELVVVGANRLRIDCVGQGRPTIILEAGLGSPSDAWEWVRNDLSATNKVCSYDRAGVGFSSMRHGPADAGAAADNLASLLKAIGETEPVVIAGHSYGGLIGRVFAQRYPRSIAALVLVELGP